MATAVPHATPPIAPALTAVEQAIVAEEEALLARVLARLAELKGERQLWGDSNLRLRELRDEVQEAREEDLAAVLDQLHTVKAVEASRRERAALPDLATPYFAHFRLREGDGPTAKLRDYLLGHTAFIDSKTGLRLLDWRNAPLSQLYYRYREGDAYEVELPGGRAEGVVEARRSLVIAEGQLRAIAGPLGRLERTADGWARRDEADLPTLMGGSGLSERGDVLGVGAGRRARVRADVSALLDPLQFEIIHDSGDGPLLVLGSAGSGKTTVALHRLAALHAKAKEGFSQKRLSVVVPEPGLQKLAHRLLGPLGLGEAEVATFTDLARAELSKVEHVPPRAVRDDSPPLVARLKRHRAFFELLPAWVERAGSGRKLEALRRELLTDRAFLQEVVAKAGGRLPLPAIEETVARTLRQLAQTAEHTYRGYDAERLQAVDGRTLDEGTPEELAQTLDSEDLPILLYLQRLTHPEASLRRRAHLVLDEAQELCALELSALREMLKKDAPSVTVAGDDVQRTGQGDFDGWERLLADLGVPDAPLRTLAVSYRCPLPIARLAHAVLGPLAPGAAPTTGRPGAAVGIHRFQGSGPQTLAMQDALQDLCAREPEASIAVLTRTGDGAVRWAEALSHVQDVRLVRRGDFSFEPGVDVCEVSEAKGLEFDYVVLPDVDAQTYREDDDARRTLHVAVTRAMHQLWLTHVGTPSGLIASAAELPAGSATKNPGGAGGSGESSAGTPQAPAARSGDATVSAGEGA